MQTKDSTILYFGPEDNISLLREIFSSGKKNPDEIAVKTGKNKGTILNTIHDLRLLCLIDGDLNFFDEARRIIYDRNAKESLKEMFTNVSGYKEAIEEINSQDELTPLNVGQIFCFHANAKSTKESSIKQIGRLYLRWLKYLDLINNKEQITEEDGS